MASSIITSISPALPISRAPKLSISKRAQNGVSLSFSSFPCCSASKRSAKGCKGGALFTFACSTSSFIGRVGMQRREGNFSLLNFGYGHNAEVAKTDSSQLLSAMLPFVVAATAVAALVQPSTFTWSVL